MSYEQPVTYKINALDDFCKDCSASCVRYLIMVLFSVVCCSSHCAMWVLNRMRAGAMMVQKHWRGNKHKQHVLSCLEVSLVPTDICCAISPCVHNTHNNPQPPNGADPPPLWRPIPYSTPAPLCMHVGSRCDKCPSSSGRRREGFHQDCLFNYQSADKW